MLVQNALDDLVVFLVLRDVSVQLVDLLTFLGHAEALTSVRLLMTVVVDLKNVQNLLLLIVFLPELIKFLLVLAHGAVMIGAVTIGAVTIGAETIDAVTIDAVTIDDGMIAGTADVTAAVTTVGDEEATNDLKR